MKPFDITDEQRARLLADADRYELISRAIREIAGFGRPSDAVLASAPVIDEWRFEPRVDNEIVGAWQSAGRPELITGRTGRVLLNTRDLTFVLTEQGWYRLGVPDVSGVKTTELPR